MSNPVELQKRHSLNGTLGFSPGPGGLTKIMITNKHADAEIFLHGAHVARFQPRGQKPVLWMSGSSWFEAGKPIRGGIPICWPWFGPHASNPALPAHGFARIKPWNVRATEQLTDGRTRVVLGLTSDNDSLAMWPHPFGLEYEIMIGTQLEVYLRVKNSGVQPFTCQEALHTYLTVSDIRNVSVSGLSEACYLDKLQNAQRLVQKGNITFSGETDRPYLNTSARCEAVDSGLQRTIVIDKRGSNSTVVWNPWINKAKAMKDFGDDEWPGMLCIETANVAENAVTLAPGASHEIRAVIGIKGA